MLAGALAGLALLLATLADPARGRRGAAGLVLVALGTSSLVTGAGTLDPGRVARVGMTAALPPWFLETTVALLVTGLLIAAVESRLPLVALCAIVAVGSLLPLLRAASLLRAGMLALCFGLIAYGAARLLSIVPRHVHLPDDADGGGVEAAAMTGPANVGFLAAVIAAASPWHGVTVVASILAFAAAQALPLRRPQRLLLGVSTLLASLAGAVVLLARVAPAGPEAPSVVTLTAGRSILVAGLLLLPSSVALAAWPCRRLAPGLLLAPAALALVGRLGADVAPTGLSWWLPAVYPVVIAGVASGLVRARPAGVLSSLAWAGLWVGTGTSRLGALLLVLSAIALTITPVGAARPVARFTWVAGGAGVGLVLHGGLSVEVVYTTLLAAVLAAGLLARTGVAAARAPA